MKRLRISLAAVVLGLGVVSTLAFAKAPSVSNDDPERWYTNASGEPIEKVADPGDDGCDPGLSQPCSAMFEIDPVSGLPTGEGTDVHTGERQ